MDWVVKLIMAAMMAAVITIVFKFAAETLGLEIVLAMLLALVIIACLARRRRG